MNAKSFMLQVSLIERFCILLFLISWCWASSRNPYSKLEAFMATVLCGVINWCYLVFSESYKEAIRWEWGIHGFHAYWSVAFWIERYALLQLLLVCWFTVSDTAASAIVGLSALFIFVCLPLVF